MMITRVRIYPVDEGPVRAYADITFDDCFAVKGLRIIHAKNGLLVAMPTEKRKHGGYEDIAFPTDAATRKRIEEAVFSEYAKIARDGRSRSPH